MCLGRPDTLALIERARSSDSSRPRSCSMKTSRSMRFSSSSRAISLYVSGSRKRNDKSSSSHFICQMPRRLANGAKTCSASRARLGDTGRLLAA